MDHEKFCEAMTELLPNISSEALDAWEAFISDMNAGEKTEAFIMRGELYAEMLLISQEYGDELATALFNMGERYVINTFELPGAAEMMASGASEREVFEEITGYGFHPPEEHREQVRLIMRNLLGNTA